MKRSDGPCGWRRKDSVKGLGSRMTVLAGLLVLLIATLGAFAAPSYGTIWPYQRAYARGLFGNEGSNWNGVRAHLEVNNGSLSATDAEGLWYYDSYAQEWIFIPGFVSEVIWAYRNTSSWVEIGYTRGWDSGGYEENVLTAYWACVTLNGVYYEHRVVNVDVSPGDDPLFTIKKKPGADNAWLCLVDGVYANDADGDHTANSSIGNNFNHYRVGLESDCSSGKLGSTSDHIGCTLIKKTSDGGDTWSQGPGTSYQLTDPSDKVHGDWIDEYVSLWNYRND